MQSNKSRELVKVQGREVRVGNTNEWTGLVATFIASQDVRESSRKLYTRMLSQYFVWMEQEGKSLTIHNIFADAAVTVEDVAAAFMGV